MHQTVSLIGTSPMVSGYYTFWQGSEEMQLRKGNNIGQQRDKHSFQDSMKATHLLQTFPKELHCLLTRDSWKRTRRSGPQGADTKSNSLPQLWTKFQTFSGQHDTQTDKAKKKKKKAKASDLQQTCSICSWVSQAQCSGSHKPLRIDLLQRRVSMTESASHAQCLPPEKSSGLPLLYSPSPNSQQPPALL